MPAVCRVLGLSVILLAAGCADVPPAEAPAEQKRALTYIDSLPAGVEVTVNGIRVGMTPVTVALKVDDAGRLVEPITIAAELRLIRPATTANATEPVSFHWESGDIPPKRMRLMPSDGGGSNAIGDYH